MFNLNNKGKVLTKISGGKYNDKIIYCDNNMVDSSDSDESGEEEDDGKESFTGGSKHNKNTFNYINIKKSGGKFEPTPDTTHERDILYVSGPSGSGKSFYSKLFIKNYIKAFPKNEIYMFSKLRSDSSLDDIKKIQRIRIDDDLITDPFEAKDFSDCLVIFDDIDSITNKLIKDSILGLMNDILQIGRHSNTSCIITNHLAAKGNETKILLSEAHIITLFLGSGQNYNYILEKYLGYTTKEIQALKKLKTRWVSFCRHYPQVIFTEYEIIPQKDLLIYNN